MLTGQTAFHAENYEGWAEQHRYTPPQPPSTHRPDLANWQGLDTLVLRLLAKDRNDRPKNVAELLNLLDAVRLVPFEVRSETVAERLRSQVTELLRGKGFRRLPRWVWITSAFVLTLGITSTAISLSITPSTIARRANILDYNHHYNLGSMLRKLACMRGHGESCNALADMYYSGNGVKQDLIRAHELYLRAAALYSPECTSGSGDACYKLAGLYKSGKGVEMDPSRADLLVKRSIEFDTEKCDAGDGKVCGILGLDYSVGGDPVQKDYVKAAEFYTKACNLGEADRGCIQLGTAYKFGWGVPESAEKAIEFYIKGCDLGEPYGCTQAGDVFDLGRYAARDAIQDYARAAALYSRACDAGDDLGCNNIGDLYRDGNGVPHDAVKARYYYSKSCSSSTNLHFGCDELKKLQ
jgi:TPR repeat protein